MKTFALTVLIVLNFFSNAQVVVFEKMTASLITNRMEQKTNLSATPSPYYSFSKHNQSYTPISGTSISNGLKWDEMKLSLPIGFNFKIFGATSNTILVNAGSSVTFNDVLNDTVLTFVSPILEDLCDKAYDPNNENEGAPGGLSNISYETVGAIGSRICKIQVSDAAFYQERSLQLSQSSTINYQIWLYEGSNDIEFHYGAINIQNASVNLFNGSNGFMCGLIDQMNIFTFVSPNSNMLNGPFTNPTMLAATQSMTNVISGNITSGTVYKFSHNDIVSGINKNTEDKMFRLYPDPTIDVINFETKHQNLTACEVQIRDLKGQLILNEPFAKTIQVGHLQKGIYFVSVFDESKRHLFSSKLVITN